MTSHGLTRRQVLALGGSAAAIAVHPAWATDADANADANADAGFAHGYSPLGALRYPPGFAAFDYVNPAAPKGGQLHLARIGTYDTLDTLVFPGRPPADLRLIYDHLVVQADDEASSFYGLLARGLDRIGHFCRRSAQFGGLSLAFGQRAGGLRAVLGRLLLGV